MYAPIEIIAEIPPNKILGCTYGEPRCGSSLLLLASVLSKPRSITTATPSALRIPRQPTQIAFQRRWATNEAEVKKVDENAPISELQPTPQEEVENAISSDNAAEPTEHATSQNSQPPSGEQSAVDSAIKATAETAANAASTVTEATESIRSAITGSGAEARQGRAPHWPNWRAKTYNLHW